MDVNWTAEFAEAGWIEPWEGENEAAPRRTASRRCSRPPSTRTRSGSRRSPPTPSSSGTTRTSWAPAVPQTWDEMIDKAKQIGPAGRARSWSRAAATRALVVWFNSLVASAGGEVITEEPRRRAGPARRRRARGHEARRRQRRPRRRSQRQGGHRQRRLPGGQPAFMVNYPFVYPSAQRTRGAVVYKNLAYARYPVDKRGRAQPRDVRRHQPRRLGLREEQGARVRGAKCLAATEKQKVAALKGGLFPTRQALYDDPEIREAYPFADLIQRDARGRRPAPREPGLQRHLAGHPGHDPPAGDIDPQATIDELGDALEKAKEVGGSSDERPKPRRPATQQTAAAPQAQEGPDRPRRARSARPRGCCARRP